MTNSRRYKSKSNSLNKLYNSFSLEFWLSILTVGVAADWIFKFGSNSLLISAIWAAILSTCLVLSNKVAGDLWTRVQRLKTPRHISLLLASSTFLFALFLINCATDPAHALIVTDSGVNEIKTLMTGSGTGAVKGLDAFANTVVLLVKVFFALAFAFGLYQSYQKYQERAELQEIVQAPVVLAVVIMAIDGFLGLIFTSTGATP
jgi:hypothetical protein